jgi:hypothetical protein
MHKFAQKWRSWTIDCDQDPPLLIHDGNVDLTTMDNGGKLKKGSHIDESGVAHDIEGEVTGNSISLRRLDKRGRWEGELTYDQKGELVIVGKQFTPSALAAKKRSAKRAAMDQNEEPWVITKP